MTEESRRLDVRGLPVVPVTVEEVLGVEKIKNSGVRLFLIQPQQFFEYLHGVFEQGNPQALDGSMAVCVGGVFRSSAINDVFSRLNVVIPIQKWSNELKKGMDMGTLASRMVHGEMNEAGRLVPEGFSAPLETLFVCINLDSDESSTNFVMLLRGFAVASRKFGKQVNLDLVIIDSRDENEITQPARVLRHMIEDHISD